MLTKLTNSLFTKTTAIALICSLFLMSFTTSPHTNKVVVLKSGTMVVLELLQSINSNDVKKGQMVQFRVVNDVKADDVVVIPAGSIATGQIEKAKKNGLLGTAGEISIAIKSVKAIDGTNIPLSSSMIGDEGSDKLVVSVVLTILCLFGFLIKGGKAEIASGAQLNAIVLSNTEISVK